MLFLKLLIVMGVSSLTIPLDYFFGSEDPLNPFEVLFRILHFVPVLAVFFIFGFNDKNRHLLKQKYPKLGSKNIRNSGENSVSGFSNETHFYEFQTWWASPCSTLLQIDVPRRTQTRHPVVDRIRQKLDNDVGNQLFRRYVLYLLTSQWDGHL